MKIRFARGLRERYESSERGKRAWGEAVARKYVGRINIMKQAKDIQDLRQVRSLNLHQLHGEYEGRYTIYLHDRWRLMFVYDESNKSIEVLEVSNHYGD